MPVPRAHIGVSTALGVLCALTVLVDGTRALSPNRSISIDFKNDVFLKDGQPFRFVSGSLHYFRVPRLYWRDRLRKMRAAGLNAVATYVEWSLHEPAPGNLNFSGELDLINFIEVAEEEGLLVNLRVGPYICAERDMGGLPPWLLSIKPDIQLRSSDRVFKFYAKRWLDALMPMVRRWLYGNGGPIFMVQVENEYGSYPACDAPYLAWLRDVFQGHVGSAAILYTTDGAGWSYLRCGKIPNVYATVDFGAGKNVTSAFIAQRAYEKHGPLVNSEYYPGWLTHWGEAMQRVRTDAVTRSLRDILDAGASVNFYVFMGGTNFGFTAGANFDKTYSPQLTSYDYDAPLTEAGDPTDKYYAIRDVIGQYLELPQLPLPRASPKLSLGPVLLRRVSELSALAAGPAVRSEFPRSFEQLRQSYGYVLYETVLPQDIPGHLYYRASNLSVPDVRDRAIVHLDQERAGVLCRTLPSTWLAVGAAPGKKLSILVENQGRINYGKFLNDSKGLGNVTLDGRLLSGWTMTSIPLDDGAKVQHLVQRRLARQRQLDEEHDTTGVYFGWFTLPTSDNATALGGLPLDSYLDTSGWGKGVAFLNGFNLGRYWPSVGPQVTLYVPGHVFKPHPQRNTLILLETDSAPTIPSLMFVKTPILDGPISPAC